MSSHSLRCTTLDEPAREARRTHHLSGRCCGIPAILVAAALCSSAAVISQADVIQVSGTVSGTATIEGSFDTSGLGTNSVDVTITSLDPQVSRTWFIVGVMRPLLWNAAERAETGAVNFWDVWGGNYSGPADDWCDGVGGGVWWVNTTGNNLTYTYNLPDHLTPPNVGALLTYTEEWEPYTRSEDTLCRGNAVFDDGTGGELVVDSHAFILSSSGGPLYNLEGSVTEATILEVGPDVWRFTWQAQITPEPTSLLLLALGAVGARQRRLSL